MPVVVLGNNDGIIVSRSNEAKAIGLKMGYPAFKAHDLMRRHRVRALSSNYALYAAMSDRLMAVLAAFSARVEKYSIDEAFVDLSGITEADAIEQGHRIRQMARQWIGLPVYVGIGPNKTIAKLANHVAKIIPEAQGVCDLTDLDRRQKCYAALGLDTVWGIGPAAVEKLVKLDYRSVESLRAMEPRLARNLLTIAGERIVYELNGVACIPIETTPAPRRGTAVTRNFGHPILAFGQLREAVAAYATRVAEKLREHRQATQLLTVFMHTNRYTDDPWYGNARKIRLQEPSSDTLLLVRIATDAAAKIWKDGFRYSKAGVLTDGLVPLGTGQRSLFEPAKPSRAPLMTALDKVNGRMGRGTLKPLGAGIRPTWKTQFGKLSPAYLSRWSDIPIAHAIDMMPPDVRRANRPRTCL